MGSLGQNPNWPYGQDFDELVNFSQNSSSFLPTHDGTQVAGYSFHPSQEHQMGYNSMNHGSSVPVQVDRSDQSGEYGSHSGNGHSTQRLSTGPSQFTRRRRGSSHSLPSVHSLGAQDPRRHRPPESGKYSCDVAGCTSRTMYTRRADLTRHQRTHKPEKIFHCGCCTNAKTTPHYKSTRKDNLVQHIEKGHKRKGDPHWCPVSGCEGEIQLAFSSLRCLEEHVRKYHSRLPDPVIRNLMCKLETPVVRKC